MNPENYPDHWSAGEKAAAAILDTPGERTLGELKAAARSFLKSQKLRRKQASLSFADNRSKILKDADAKDKKRRDSARQVEYNRRYRAKKKKERDEKAAYFRSLGLSPSGHPLPPLPSQDQYKRKCGRRMKEKPLRFRIQKPQ